MKRLSGRTLRLISAAAALLVWQAAAAAVSDPILLASPAEVGRRFLTIWRDADFWKVLAFSTGHITGGFLLALTAGTALGLLAARFRPAEILLWPYVTLIKTVPVASFIILALIWFDGRQLNLFISFLMVFPVVYSNVLEGVRSTDPAMEEMMALYRVPWIRRMRYVYLTQLRPYLAAAVRVGTGTAWKAGAAAEVIAVVSGSVGGKLYESKIYLETADLCVWTILIVLISVLLEKLMLRLLEAARRALEDG